jgi:hypothetical protein
MKKIYGFFAVVLFCSSFLNASGKSIESIKSEKFEFKKVDISLPVEVIAEKDNNAMEEDYSYRFERLSNDLWQFQNNIVWLRNDIDKLAMDARNISYGQNIPFFQNDLRNMSYKMSQLYNDIQRISMDLKNLLTVAKKDSKLNQIASDIEMRSIDIDNKFQFDIVNSARDLELAVRSVDPKIIGYDSQWLASDIYSYSNDIQWKTRDIRWDSQKLYETTKP